MATHLANHYPQHVDFLMIDRSLSSLNEMARNALTGSCNNFLLDWLSRGWALSSDKNFYNAKCFKLLTQDPEDNIVPALSALCTTVAREACDDLLGEQRHINLKIEKAFNAMRMLYHIDAALHTALKKQFAAEKKA